MQPPDDGAARDGARYKTLYRKLEDAVARIERVDDVASMLENILEHLLEQFADELGFEGGRIYSRQSDDFVLCCGFGSSRGAPRGLRVPRDYPPHRRLLEDGIVIMQRGERGFDEAFENTIGVGSMFAAIAVGEGHQHIIAFSVRSPAREEDLLSSLTLVRHVIHLKLQHRRITGMIEAARVLQESITPRVPPGFGGFDIAGVSRPSEIVSGDLFDYLVVSECCLGIAIADSCGHGLPAALLARDAITALRMGAGRGDDSAALVSRLNGVIHRNALDGTFVSLFYAQVQSDGAIDYCNAGHLPPLLVRGHDLIELDAGGTVLGPIPAARYEGGSERLRSGDLLLLYTDGIVERDDGFGDTYGFDRLRALVPRLRGLDASRIVNAVLASAEAFARGAPARDDMTVVALRMP